MATSCISPAAVKKAVGADSAAAAEQMAASSKKQEGALADARNELEALRQEAAALRSSTQAAVIRPCSATA